ncbi:MAG: M20/M25/M40 family metallo-hydrolase [Gemmatimonadota bacterium]|nr:M20/M25/M40 family metallo-hydrolase [Gemmatimonadota bacterium]MDH3366748.1 M20/M25/M40 family metallo-hydrolase [Gemmatimonadota bacterium]MDH3478233.1 M20/M25/M40 family metallo-hydrolase [Gemmatimonadota bacterium]MDH5549030.1 M20/M25/M40 family metallo-hydrolase [Gemmatimonadota bacterium]
MHALRRLALTSLLASLPTLLVAAPAGAQESDAARLVTALLGETPVVRDAQWLTDRIGGRVTGSQANLDGVAWALEAFESAGVPARREAFTMPARWLEQSARALVRGDVEFAARVAAMPFSIGTPAGGITARLVDGGRGSAADFERLGAAVRGAFVLVETDELVDVAGLFREYVEATAIEARAFERGVAGIIYMGSRPNNLLYRHNASRGSANRHPLVVMERDAATRAMRLLRAGAKLSVTLHLTIEGGGPYESYNVIGEIKGTAQPEEIVIIGAHLDSWDIGTGALDNGGNVAMLIDIARQIHRLGLRPRRTIRFALWNGEEQGLVGSWKYVEQHRSELDRVVMASSYDIGTGRIAGFFTGGRPEIVTAVDEALAPIAGLGPFQQIDVPIVGTDNFDFMMEGIANLVANQESANYGPNYHARSDTFDRIDVRQLKLNAAIAAAVTWGSANMDVTWQRQSRDEVERLVAATDLEAQMRSLGVWEDWAAGRRGRQP